MYNIKKLSIIAFAILILLPIGHSQLLNTALLNNSYDQIILNDHPVLYLAMNTPSGIENDLSNHGLLGAYLGGIPNLVSMPNGDMAVDFNGNSEYVTVPSNSSLSISTTHSLTWEAWIRPDTLQMPGAINAGYVNWIGKCVNPQCEWQGRMYNTNNTQNRINRISGYVFNLSGGLGSGSDWQPNGVGIIQAGQWYHVVVEYTTLTQPSVCSNTGQYPGSINFWLNGVEWNQSFHGQTGCMSQFNIAPTAGSAPLTIGTIAQASWFQGAIGKVSVYNYLLTQNQINSHYTAMTTLNPSGSCASTCSFGISNTTSSSTTSTSTSTTSTSSSSTSVTSTPSITSTSTSTTSIPQFQIKVQSADLYGQPIIGMYVQVNSTINNTKIQSGNTPIIFNLVQGQSYKIYSTNFKNNTFEHWGNNANKSAYITITLKQNMILTEYYNTTPIGNTTISTTSSTTSSSTSTSSSSSTTSTVTTTSTSTSSSSLTTTISQIILPSVKFNLINNQLFLSGTGFAPYKGVITVEGLTIRYGNVDANVNGQGNWNDSFSLTKGENYTVYVYNNYTTSSITNPPAPIVLKITLPPGNLTTKLSGGILTVYGSSFSPNTRTALTIEGVPRYGNIGEYPNASGNWNDTFGINLNQTYTISAYDNLGVSQGYPYPIPAVITINT